MTGDLHCHTTLSDGSLGITQNLHENYIILSYMTNPQCRNSAI